ncbi:MAG: (2E,6E)-farnesyl diphosphate synthase [Pseudomonadota bacterium]|nr:(2E,6E)-farnesyl diphosphate synthase [Pseudomonadota bacterium]
MTQGGRSYVPSLFLESWSACADEALARVLPPDASEPRELVGAMRYAVLGAGKRLRPLLVYATGTALGADERALDAPACAVELIHAYSLVHDDLPAMDNDDLRRGRPTCHVAFGEATAILAGDALQALAFEILAADCAPSIETATRVEMLRVLSAACGAQGMAGGQAFDLAAVGKTLDRDELERMHAHKTGALIRAGVRLGALAAGCDDGDTMDALDRYGHAIGLAFQVRDDLLDVEGHADVIGKTSGKDAAAAKPTFPSVLGMDASRVRLRALTDEALAALSPLRERAAPLAELARYVAERDR